MSDTELKTHEVDDEVAAKALDKKIRTDLKGQALQFVKIGLALRDMNLSGGYVHLGFDDPKTGWPDYLRSLPGLALRTAQDYVQAALVMDCFSTRPSALVPENMAQCLKLANGVANFTRSKSAKVQVQGRGKLTPVKVTNSKEVVEVWGKVVEKHDEAVERAKKNGTKPPILSASKVRDYLPKENQNKLSQAEPVIARRPAQDPFDGWLSKMASHWVAWKNKEFPDEKIKEWATVGRGDSGKPWSPATLQQYMRIVDEWEANIREVKEVLSNVHL
jgi:hypothetical protein